MELNKKDLLKLVNNTMSSAIMTLLSCAGVFIIFTATKFSIRLIGFSCFAFAMTILIISTMLINDLEDGKFTLIHGTIESIEGKTVQIGKEFFDIAADVSLLGQKVYVLLISEQPFAVIFDDNLTVNEDIKSHVLEK